MSTPSRYSLEMLDARGVTAALVAEMSAAAASAVEPNAFFEPWMLLPAIEMLASRPVELVLVRRSSGVLAGYFPAERRSRFRHLPVASVRTWRHQYGFLGTPIIAHEDADAVLGTVLDALADGRLGAPLLEWTGLRGDGPFARLLAAQMARRPAQAMDARKHERALLVPGETPGPGISGRHRKELRRLERRLAEHGDLAYRVFEGVGDPTRWVNEFLTLEAAGWKGREGTALASEQQSRDYFERIVRGGAREGKVQMLALDVGGVPVAMKCNFLSGDGAFAFKIAYREGFARYSPGVLLEIHTMDHIAANCPGTLWVDSCAKPHHSMIERLWTGRRMIESCVMSSRALHARSVVRILPRVRTMRARLRRAPAAAASGGEST